MILVEALCLSTWENYILLMHVQTLHLYCRSRLLPLDWMHEIIDYLHSHQQRYGMLLLLLSNNKDWCILHSSDDRSCCCLPPKSRLPSWRKRKCAQCLVERPWWEGEPWSCVAWFVLHFYILICALIVMKRRYCIPRLQCFIGPKLGGGQEWDGCSSLRRVFPNKVAEGSVSCTTQLIWHLLHAIKGWDPLVCHHVKFEGEYRLRNSPAPEFHTIVQWAHMLVTWSHTSHPVVGTGVHSCYRRN